MQSQRERPGLMRWFNSLLAVQITHELESFTHELESLIETLLQSEQTSRYFSHTYTVVDSN